MGVESRLGLEGCCLWAVWGGLSDVAGIDDTVVSIVNGHGKLVSGQAPERS